METIPAFYFDKKRLEEIAHSLGGNTAFREAQPFPHVVIDDFLPQEVLQLLIREFPKEDAIPWDAWGPGRTKKLEEVKLNKLGQDDETYFGPFLRHFMSQLLSHTFLQFVERVSGYKGLIVDPSHNGCGLHSTGRGGRLMIHTDINRHPHSGAHLHQLMNLIIYLNEDWSEEFGGHLELWTADRKPGRKILPIANRAVLFETGTRSFHGQPEPLTCPEGRRRNSLAVYYYSYDRLVDQAYDGMQQGVRWVETTEEDRKFAKSRVEALKRSIERHIGKTIEVDREIVPFQLGGAGAQLCLSLVDHGAMSGTDKLALESSIKRMSGGGGDPEWGSSLRGLGYLGISSDAKSGDQGSILLAYSDRDAAVYVESPESGRPLFIGYFEMIWARIFPGDRKKSN